MVPFFRRAGGIDLRRGPSKDHETETVDQQKKNASSLFVAFARSFGTAEIIHDRGHAPERHMNSVVLVIRWSTNNVVSQRVHRERLDVKPQRANRTMFLFGRRRFCSRSHHVLTLLRSACSQIIEVNCSRAHSLWKADVTDTKLAFFFSRRGRRESVRLQGRVIVSVTKRSSETCC